MHLRAKVLAAVLVIGALIPLWNVLAAGTTYTITYNNKSMSYTRTYAAGSAITLDALPTGSIAWTDSNDPNSPNGKMAYVGYDQTLTINRNMTLTANFGDYSDGVGPRVVQYHLELKYYDYVNQVEMQFDQHYNNINAPAGYYIHLPNATYFGDNLQAIVGNAGGMVPTGKVISAWVNDSAYTGGQVNNTFTTFTPSALVYVDPNNYNMIYNAMVDQSYDINGGSGGTFTPAPNTDTVTFRLSSYDLPSIPCTTQPSDMQGGTTQVCGGAFATIWQSDGSGTVPSGDPLINWYDQQAQLVIPNIPDATGTWRDDVIDCFDYMSQPLCRTPGAWPVAGYHSYWQLDDNATPFASDDGYNGLSGLSAALAALPNGGLDALVGGSHTLTLQYVPDQTTVQVLIKGHTDNVVYDGNMHEVTGYDVYTCADISDNSTCVLDGSSDLSGNYTFGNGDILTFTNISTTSSLTASGTTVGSYNQVLLVKDFLVTNTSGDVYNLTIAPGGLSITPRPIYIGVPTIDTSTPGDQDVSVIVTNPTGDPDTGGLAPGQEVVTPNGDGTITVDVDGNGNITYPQTNDPTAPGYNPIKVVDRGNGDADVSDNYDLDNAWNHLVAAPGVPNTGAHADSDGSGATSTVAPALVLGAGVVVVAVWCVSHKRISLRKR